jgi:myo-inositol-1(or 4)-monophosphatase
VCAYFCYNYYMAIDYQKVIAFVLESGKRLVARAGNIADIGISKKDLTEEDLAIERGFKEIVSGFGADHVLYAEEENDIFQKSENIWVVDPISGTHNLIEGKPHYAVVISHLVHHKPVFAAVYDPSVDELFTAQLGKGAFLNGAPIRVSTLASKIIIRVSAAWKKPELVEKVTTALAHFAVEDNRYSMAVNYCAVASGRAGGIIAFTKDSFPEFAGSLIVQEAGGMFTNVKGDSVISPDDRIFVGGNSKVYERLLSITQGGIEGTNL